MVEPRTKPKTRRFLGASLGAMFASLLGFEEDKATRARIAATQKKERRSRVPTHKWASPQRAEKRVRLRAAYLRRLKRERDIGVDPIYANGPRSLREDASADWRGRAKAWERAHG